jgi:hypothetical protein
MDEEHGWIVVEDVRGLIKNLWKGFVDGFMSKKTGGTTIRVDDEMCFGEWITKDAEFVGAYWDAAFAKGIWTVTYEDTMEMVYDVVDMIFLQVEYCKFKEFIYEIYFFLEANDITADFWHRIENDVFAIIQSVTEISDASTMIAKDTEDWPVLDQQAYTLGHGFSRLVAVIIGFH